MKVMVWNVNGIRACVRKGFSEWFEEAQPAVLGLQEVRARPEEIPGEVAGLAGYHKYWFPAERAGYSGVGLLTRRKPLQVIRGLGVPEFDQEGRVLAAEYPRWVFFVVYFPKGSGKDRDNSRVPYKLGFYERVLDEVRVWMGRGKGVVVGGDFNTAHREIDLTNWKTNRTTSGFLPEERAALDRYLDAGLVDVFRDQHPGESGHHTWWSQRSGARARNVGWRIDYLMPTRDIAPWVRRSWHEPAVMASDHCPLGIDLVVPRR
jgi:exodeoxyribonuclease-3